MQDSTSGSRLQSLWMVVAGILFASMGVCVKLASAEFSAAELVFYRGFISMLLLGMWVVAVGQNLRTPHWRAHIRRGISGAVSLVLYFLAIANLPLATAVTLNYTAPLFLAVIIVFGMRERTHGGLWLALLLGMLGIMALLRPTVQSGQGWGVVCGLSSGVLAAVAYFNVRQLGRLDEPEWRTVFYFSLSSSLFGLPWMAWDGMHTPDLRGGLLLLGVGGFGALAQLAMTRAYKHGKTLLSASLAYLTVVFSALYGVLIWHEVMPMLAWFGMLLIIISGVLAGWVSSRQVVVTDV